MSSPAFPPETTPVSVTLPNLTMPPEIDFSPPPSPPSLPPETAVSSPLPSSSSLPLISPQSSPPPTLPLLTPPLSPPDINLPQTPPVSDTTPPPLPPDPSPLPPVVSPPATVIPPPTIRSQPPSSLPKEPSHSTSPVVVKNPPPQFSTPSPTSSPVTTTPITNSPPSRHHHRGTHTPTFPSPDPKTPTKTTTTTPTSPSRSSHSSTSPIPNTTPNPNTNPQEPDNPNTNPQEPDNPNTNPQEPDTRVHEHPPFPSEQASSPDAEAASSPLPGTTIPESEMPLLPQPLSPESGQPVVVGGVEGGHGMIGSQPASSGLPIGVDMTPDLAAGRSSSTRVSTGIVVGLGVGGVILLLLLVFGILVVFFRKKKGGNATAGVVGTGFRICNKDNRDIEGKISLPRYSKQTRISEDNQIWENTIPSLPKQTTSNLTNASSSAFGSNHGSNHAMAMAMGFSSGNTFTYEELSTATGGFTESNLLGKGGFGYVYKGILPNGKEVAVKQLKLGGHQGEREFQAEVETISQVHHKHLVSLVGYCIAGVERLLVYDFVPNNTLDFHLHGMGQEVMPWSRRLKIAIGSGKGLAYLHEDCNPSIIHRDIKAANILLDFNCEAKVSDFGLAKICSNSNEVVTHITTRVVGTFGYLAPEYASSGKLTDKSDVYSYGVMLLELITGRPPITHTAGSEEMNGSLVNWARPLLAQAIEEGEFRTIVDPRLLNNYNHNEMASMVACAAACIRLSAWRRPRMCQVVRALEGDLSPSNLDDGVRPGQSSNMHRFPYESSSSDFDARKYMEEIKRFKRELASSGGSVNNTTTSNFNDNNTSEYGLNPSISS